MMSSSSDEFFKDNEIFLMASQVYEESVKVDCSITDCDLSWEIPKEYEHMTKDDFLFDNLLPNEFKEDSDELQAKKLDDSDRKKGDDVCDLSNSERFGPLVTEKDILDKIEGTVPVTTRRATMWAVKIWQDWIESRKNHGITAEVPPQLNGITNDQLNYWMS